MAILKRYHYFVNFAPHAEYSLDKHVKKQYNSKYKPDILFGSSVADGMYVESLARYFRNRRNNDKRLLIAFHNELL